MRARLSACLPLISTLLLFILTKGLFVLPIPGVLQLPGNFLFKIDQIESIPQFQLGTHGKFTNINWSAPDPTRPGKYRD